MPQAIGYDTGRTPPTRIHSQFIRSSTPTPDAFALVLLEGDGTTVHTADPSGADSLLAINIDFAQPMILTFSSNLTPAGVVGVIPEPPSAFLIAMGLLIVLSSTRQAAPSRHFSGRRAPVISENSRSHGTSDHLARSQA